MSWRTLPQSLGVDVLALKAAAFELSPDPAMVVDETGALVAVNEAAEALFGQGLGLLARGRFSAALPPGSALVSLLNRAIEEQAKVRERGVQISLFGLAPFEADGAAAPLGDGSVLLTLTVKAGLGVERGGAEAAGGLRSIVGLGRMLAHEIKNPLAGIRGAAQLLKSGAKAEDAPLAQLIVDETDRVRRLVDRMEKCGLLSRCPVASDGRGVAAALTETGLTRLRVASRTHLAGVANHFAARLSEDDLAALDRISRRLAG